MKILRLLLILSCCGLFTESAGQVKAKNPRKVVDSLFREFEFKAAELTLKNWIQEGGSKNQLPDDHYYLARIQAKLKKNEESISTLALSLRLSELKGKLPLSMDVYIEEEFKEVRNDNSFKSLLESYYPKTEIEFLYKKEISYDELIQYLKSFPEGNRSGGKIWVEDKMIYWKKEGDQYIYNDIKRPIILPDIKVIEQGGLHFEKCRFKLHLIWARQKMTPRVYPFHYLGFNKCEFEGRMALVNLQMKSKSVMAETNFIKASQLDFYDCVFHEQSFIDMVGDSNTSIGIYNSQLNDLIIYDREASGLSLGLNTNRFSDSTEVEINLSKSGRASLFSNEMSQTMIKIYSDLHSLFIDKNNINYLVFTNNNFPERFSFNENRIQQKILFNNQVSFSDAFDKMNWADLVGHKIGLDKKIPINNLYITSDTTIFNDSRDYDARPFEFPKDEYINTGEREEDIADPQSFRSLIGLHSLFLQAYKSKMDMENYNACYISVKDLQSKRLGYLYEVNPTFQTYFSWRLSQLLKFYVNHGTEPARAIVISLYIIFGFGIFFFFFPSDWDTTSKKNLIRNFKDFREKNDKGYFKPFMLLLGGFALSLANAVTLSLNAFITLGFGNIPTRGIARYVCVLEGFMGWFLLSIFTVALINQVL